MFKRKHSLAEPLTVKKLTSDKTATEVGYWPRPVVDRHGKKVELLIVRGQINSYFLYDRQNKMLLANTPTLSTIVDEYNNYVVRLQDG